MVSSVTSACDCACLKSISACHRAGAPERWGVRKAEARRAATCLTRRRFGYCSLACAKILCNLLPVGIAMHLPLLLSSTAADGAAAPWHRDEAINDALGQRACFCRRWNDTETTETGRLVAHRVRDLLPTIRSAVHLTTAHAAPACHAATGP